MNVVFFHLGPQPYLEVAIRQAAAFNKVILLGDESNSFLGDIDNVYHVNFNELNSEVDRFTNNYIHLSNNSLNLEISSYVRWIYIRNLMRSTKMSICFHSDSDNLIYSDLEEPYKFLGSPNFALSVPYNQPEFRWSAAGTTSFWSLEVLEGFCEFLFSLYEDKDKFKNLLETKWRHHQENNVAGGVCDMTALWHFSQITPPDKILTKATDYHFTFDHNINTSENHFRDEYRLTNGLKDVTIKDGHPHSYNLISNENIKFHTLHFQGQSKALMSSFSTYHD